MVLGWVLVGEGDDKLSMEVWRLVDSRMVLGGLGFISGGGLNTGHSALLVLLIKPKISQELLDFSGASGTTLGQNGRFEAADLEDFMD